MQIECTGRQVTVTKSLRAQAEEGAERIGKILGRSTVAHIVLTTEKHRYIAEVSVKNRACSLVALCESNVGLDVALRESLAKVESQAVRHKNKIRAKKRQPKEEKLLDSSPLATLAGDDRPGRSEKKSQSSPTGNGARSKSTIPVTVHSFPTRVPITEPHVVRSSDSVAMRPMTLEEAVKEAEFRDREVFVFRDNQGNVKVLHRKRDGKMELIDVP